MRIDIGTSGNYPPTSHGLRNFAVDNTLGTAVHEFGHALGLAHEHERTDAPNCNDQQRQSQTSNLVYVGKYDPSSIMNYCKSNNINSLSAGDVGGLNFLYPKAPISSGELAGEFYLKARHSDKCVDISGSSRDDGANVQQWTCNQSGAQRFRFVQEAGGSYSIRNVNSGKCIDSSGWGTADGTNLLQWSCHGGANQQVQVKSMAGGAKMFQFVHSQKCMDVTGAKREEGANVALWSCGSDVANEQYSLVRAN